jgi:hypothetical protein
MAQTERTDALYDLEAVKRWMGKQDNVDDSLILDIGNQVSAFVERYCGRKFLTNQYVHDGTTLARIVPRHSRDLFLPNPPVTAVSALKTYNGGAALTESTDGITGDFVILTGPGIVRLITERFPYLDMPSVEITYTGGFLGSGASAADRKEWGWVERAGDLQTAVNKQVAWLYNQREKEREGILSVSSGGSTVQYMREALLPDVRETLDAYARISPSWV